jgi:hypothetical protein
MTINNLSFIERHFGMLFQRTHKPKALCLSTKNSLLHSYPSQELECAHVYFAESNISWFCIYLHMCLGTWVQHVLLSNTAKLSAWWSLG